MSDRLTIDVDNRSLLAALDRLGALAEKHVQAAAKETADRIAAEARARVARRTGTTAHGIGVDIARVGSGYVVFADRPDNPGLPGWLEFGTERMTARPFLFASARLEEAAHDRRIRQAVQDAIDEVGR
jgi:hypothetical protein